MAQRMVGYTDARSRPTADHYTALLAPEQATPTRAADDGRPYPFFLAHALPAATSLDAWGPVADWLVEWKYDGIRAQLVRRGGRVWLWSRGEELVSDAFPEVIEQAQALPEGTVLDGELLVWQDGRPASFALLQRRLGRQRVSVRMRAQFPVALLAYDLLEEGGQDLRARPQRERRQRLQALLAQGPFAVSPALAPSAWPELAAQRQRARVQGVEGLMLKRMDSAYGVGRARSEGLWLKWKVDPLVVDGVLIYAQAGHGRRASLYTDYTFAVWNRRPASAEEAQAVVEAIAAGRPLPSQEGLPLCAQPLQLVSFAKAYSGLSDAQFKQVDALIRRTTLQKFGPVRSVRPSLVFELAFEGIQESSRHKSGVALRFPRMARLRPDKPLHEANTLADLRQLMREAALAAA
jgi:DNA ligase-1